MGCAATKTAPANPESQVIEEVDSNGNTKKTSMNTDSSSGETKKKGWRSRKDTPALKRDVWGGVSIKDEDDDVFVEGEETSYNNSVLVMPPIDENKWEFPSNKKAFIKNNVSTGPVCVTGRETSQSQTDFFRMLDEKIAKGKSFSSSESIR